MKIEPEVLLRFESLSSLGETDLRMMASTLEGSQFRAGALVCGEGDSGDCCYFLLEGSVAVSKVLPDGRRVRLAVLGENTLFGQAGLVPGRTRTADVKAESPVVIATLSRRSLNWALSQKQDWAVAVQAIVAINLVRQLRSALDRLEDLAAAEDPSAQIEGRKRSEIQRPQGLDLQFAGGPRRPQEAAPDAAYAPLPPIPVDDGGAMQQRDLLGLLASSEASLAQAGLDLTNIEFVFDDDQQRTAEARLRG